MVIGSSDCTGRWLWDWWNPRRDNAFRELVGNFFAKRVLLVYKRLIGKVRSEHVKKNQRQKAWTKVIKHTRKDDQRRRVFFTLVDVFFFFVFFFYADLSQDKIVSVQAPWSIMMAP